MIDATLARKIKLVGLDVDGVLTDGGIYLGRVGDHAVEFKRFHSQDGTGAWLLRTAGIVVAFASGRHSEATLLRAREMRIDDVLEDHTSSGQKLEMFEALLNRRGVAWEESAFVGDDLADIPLLARVALPIAVANAVPEVKAVAQFVTKHAGGDGAVREVAEVILRSRGVWDELVDDYLKERGNAEPRAQRSR